MASKDANVTDITCMCTFSVPGFSKLPFAVGDKYVSAKTTVEDACFALQLYPGGYTAATPGYISCYLANESDKNLSCKVKFELMAGEDAAKTSSCDANIAPRTGYGWNDYALRTYILDPSNRVLNEGCLQIRATVTIHSQPLPIKPTCVKSADGYTYTSGPGTAQGDLMRAHDGVPDSSDFTIVVSAKACEEAAVPGDTFIHVHKFVLSTRSPVFRAMLSSGMQEASADEMEITGYAVDAVRAFVRFLYCDACTEEALKDHSWDLLSMADKYDVPALRFVCEIYLAEHLQDESAAITLQRADTHNAPVLKRKALEYIAQHKKAVADMPALLRELSSDLLTEVVCALAK
jgi:hypothetical protein